jgi:hypothetical protein
LSSSNDGTVIVDGVQSPSRCTVIERSDATVFSFFSSRQKTKSDAKTDRIKQGSDRAEGKRTLAREEKERERKGKGDLQHTKQDIETVLLLLFRQTPHFSAFFPLEKILPKKLFGRFLSAVEPVTLGAGLDEAPSAD